ncbi:MAG TPA: PadR family transcriptional regulator [Ktedonobacterales bacterium]|jgi:PadR family transcriptional regulator PadR
MQEMKKGSLGMLALQLLHARPDYGYELCARLRERSAGAISFEDAAIYPLLHEYERRGLLEGYWESASEAGPAAEGARKGPRRRYYRVTPAGMAALRASIAEWNSFTQGVARILGDSDVQMAGD